jgi:hypothetical protein
MVPLLLQKRLGNCDNSGRLSQEKNMADGLIFLSLADVTIGVESSGSNQTPRKMAASYE